MAKKTVANLLQVPIHYYVLVDWRAFIDVIDLIGGVDLYVEKDMYYEDPYADLFIDIKHGYQHLDGSGQANMCVSAKMSWVILAACKGSRSL